MVYLALVRDLKDQSPDTSLSDIRARLDAILKGETLEQKAEEVFNPDTWGTSAEAQAKQTSMMSLVGSMSPAVRRREREGGEPPSLS